MQTKGLDMRKNGNVVLIAPREELAVKEKQQLEAQQQISELEPLHDRSRSSSTTSRRRIWSISSRAIAPAFGGAAVAPPAAKARYSRSAACAIVDPRTNILFVPDTARPSRGSAQDHPPDRYSGTPGRRSRAASSSPDDKFSRQLGVRFGMQTGFTLQQALCGRHRRHAVSTQPVVHLHGGHDVHARNAHADAVSSSHRESPARATRIRRSST